MVSHLSWDFHSHNVCVVFLIRKAALDYILRQSSSRVAAKTLRLQTTWLRYHITCAPLSPMYQLVYTIEASTITLCREKPV